MPSILFRPKPNVEKTPAAPKASPLCCGSLQPTNQSTNMSTALNINSTRSTVPGTVAISDDEMPRFAPSVFASQPIEGVFGKVQFSSYFLHLERDARKWLGSRTRTRAEHSNRSTARLPENTLCGLLGLSISRAEKRTKSGPRSFW
jgi:hypothetical protein